MGRLHSHNLLASRYTYVEKRLGYCDELTGYVSLILFQDECHNFIKVLLKKNNETLFVCGTNAFNPSCRNYKVNAVLLSGTILPGNIL